MRRILFLCLMFYFPLLCNGQGKSLQNWYWANRSAIDFSTTPPTVKQQFVTNYTVSSACISDDSTGQLLFFTDGTNLFASNSQIIGNTGVDVNSVADVLIIPLKAKRQYLLFVNERRAVRNCRLRAFSINLNLSGNVVAGEKTIAVPGQDMNLMNRITAVKHCAAEGYWVITIAFPYQFQAWYVSGSGTVQAPVATNHHILFPPDYCGDMVASNDGKKLVFTTYSDKYEDECRVYDFDNRCGTFGYATTLLPAKDTWTRSHGAVFSPNGRFVYISYGYQASQLVQYTLSNPSDNVLIATSPENFNQMGLAFDGKVYITTHISGVPANKLDVIAKPDEKGAQCEYKSDALRTGGPTNFHVPNIVSETIGSCTAGGSFSVSIGSNRCSDLPIIFSLKMTLGFCDSFLWLFMDPNNPGSSSRSDNASYQYKSGTYRPALVLWFCQLKDTVYYDLEVSDLERPNLGPDLEICNGNSISLGPGSSSAKSWLWSTGSTDSIITVNASGKYKLQVKNGFCTKEDDITVNVLPPIFTALGAEYFICEDDKELVELDAGEGFKRYRWTPTDDTTRWIVVDKRGDYFVLVEDYRGCKGDGNTIVKSVCDMKIWFPSSFTPNGDGLNDIFRGEGQNIISVEILVYNRWGEEVYHSYDINGGWDGEYLGNHASDGVYVWKARATGFMNKKKVVNNFYGTVELIR